MKNKLIILSMSVWLLVLSGCVSSQPAARPVLNVKVIATNTRTPLSIHFFTLKSNEVFKKLDYFELVSSKKINWNDELISRAKTLLVPGSTEIFQVQMTGDLQYYALVIGFKDVEDNDNWRYLQAVNPSENHNVALSLSQVDGYTSKAVVRASERSTHTSGSNRDNIVTKKVKSTGNAVSNKIGNAANRAIDSGINKVFRRIF